MKENGSIKRSEKRVKKFKALKDFGDQTSFHGFRYVAEHSSFSIRRLLWFLLILACFGGLVFQIVDRVTYYFGWPVTVNVGVNYNKTLEFPAVTICNQNAFKASLATEYGWYEMIEKMFTTQASLDDLLQNNMYENITLETLYLKTAHERDDFIFSCSWKGIPCKPDDFNKILTDHGVCFTWNNKDDHYVSSPGVENGLKLRLNVEQYEYMPGPHDAAGIKILIHDRLEIPRVYALGQAVSTGSNVFAGEAFYNFPYNYVSLTFPIVSECREKMAETFGLRYSQGACKLDCLSHTAAQMCGCRHIYMPSKDGYPPVCTIKQYYGCLKQILDDFPSMYEENCNCPVPCTFNAYQNDISYASTSRFAANKFLAGNVTQELGEKLMNANEVTSRMDGDKLEEFKDLYTNFHTKLSVVENELFGNLMNLLGEELADNAYANRSVTDDEMFYGIEEFRWLMRNWRYAKAVTYYEVVERPYRILQDRHSEFEQKCFSAEAVMESIEETIHSLTNTIRSVNNTLFAPLHLISSITDRYFSNFVGTKYDIGTQFLSGQVKNGKLDLTNLLQLILTDDSDISSELDRVFSYHLEIYETIVNDQDSFIYYNFSNHSEYLQTFEDIKEMITSNYTGLKALLTLYETVGEDGTAFLQSVKNLEEYFSAYMGMMNINNEFIKENFLQLDIFYKQMSYEEITQQEAYDPFALICDIGGSMGLFLGASLLSWCEILDLFITNFMLPRNRPQK
ncbi:unnamed protein product [Mytilus edulis]|uniref:Uncharacterized protein n=1 Tax=Mytilus edulis TaxID=6550 RepID=A0A8S3UE17_MYTED|nr:unnamed protein product [Mytilus edulis]